MGGRWLLVAAALLGVGGVASVGVSAEEEAAPPADLISPSRGLADLSAQAESELAQAVSRFSNDWRALSRRYDIPGSSERRERFRRFYEQWLEALDQVEWASLGLEGQVDWLLLRNRARYQIAELDREAKLWSEAAPLLPFTETVIGFQEARRRRESVDAQGAAAALEQMKDSIEKTQKALERGLAEEAKEKQAAEQPEPTGSKTKAPSKKKSKAAAKAAASREKETEGKVEKQEPALRTTKTIAHRAARYSESLKRTLKGWYEYSSGYDPLFSWWASDPYEQATKALDGYVDFLKKKVVGVEEGEDPPIVGDPVGRQALLDQLESEIIAYTPEELVALAKAELAWCEEEMRKAAQEMGFGDDWKAALEKVKTLHVPPGEQPKLVRELAAEAIDFLEERELVTIPPLAKEVWRIEMMSPERQKMNPFFLGGETIRVAFPTDTMSHEEKMMSMRGNNRHFSKATVHHELIPGHHLQGFMTSRYNSHRSLFRTPFWGEGWALYWELYFYDIGFPKSPEDRVGMLFWRMHRCARVIWSLGFHLGDMTPQESIDFLVERIGHERENATGEVRRSFEGTYPPLYQLAYLMGGFQFRALHQELVGGGQMTDREFHDRILRGGRMPVEMVRARLTGQELSPDYRAQWKFRGEVALEGARADDAGDAGDGQ